MTPDHILAKQMPLLLNSLTVASRNFRCGFGPKTSREMPDSYTEAPTFYNAHRKARELMTSYT